MNKQNAGEGNNDETGDNNGVHMQKQLGLLEGVAIILGIIIGSGIFISPKGVIREVESAGGSIVIWLLCGALSTIGALCYAELGACIRESGGDYTYIHKAYGNLPSFLYLWDSMMIVVPSTNAIMALTFATYVLDSWYPNGCHPPELAIQLLAAITISFLTFINCYNMKATTKMQNIIMFTKISALCFVIIIGIVWMSLGHTDNFDKPFKNTVVEPGNIAVAFYSGIFSFAGWNYLNFMTEELKDPIKNLPRAIYISLPIVTIIYVLANVAYLAVLTPSEMIASNAIAVDFGVKMLGDWNVIIPILVAISAFGGLSVHIMTSSRICFVGARKGHMPVLLSHINIKNYTPIPSLVFLCFVSILMLLISDVYVLITYCSIVESFFIMLSIAGSVYLRFTKPDMIRPIKMPLCLSILFVIICFFLIVVPIYVAPFEVAMGVLITLIGLPIYYVGVVWENKPSWIINFEANFTLTCQKLFMSVKEDKED